MLQIFWGRIQVCYEIILQYTRKLYKKNCLDPPIQFTEAEKPDFDISFILKVESKEKLMRPAFHSTTPYTPIFKSKFYSHVFLYFWL